MADYDTQLSSDEQKSYQDWAAAGGRDPEQEKNDYDLQGYFKSGGKLDEGHMPDTYKKPNHPTFSDESQYHGQDGNEGGHWSQTTEGRDQFTPGRTNLDTWGPQGLQSYFKKHEPGVELNLPSSPYDGMEE